MDIFTLKKIIFYPCLFLAAGLFLSPTAVSAQFMDIGFNTSPSYNAYQSPVTTPTKAQFNTINGTGFFPSISGGAIRFNCGAANQFAMIRSSNFSGSPLSLIVRLDVEIESSNSNVNQAVILQVGENFTPNSLVPEPNANVLAQFGLNFNNSAQFEARDITNNTNQGAFQGGKNHIVWAINRSGSSLTYAAPDNANETLPNNSADFWVNGVKVFNNVALQTATVKPLNFKCLLQNAEAVVKFDNFHINPINKYEGTYRVGLGGDFQSFTKANGLFHALDGLKATPASPANNITGDLVFQVISNINDEDGTHPLYQLPSMAANSFLIQPDGSQSRIVQGSFGGTPTARGLFRFVGADQITIDGRALGSTNVSFSEPKRLSFINNSPNVSPDNATFNLSTGATNNVFQFVNFQGANADTTTAVVRFDTSSVGVGNCQNQFSFCEFFESSVSTLPRQLIFSAGSVGFPNRDNSIQNNYFRNNSIELNGGGMLHLAENNRNWTIEGNSFYLNYDTVWSNSGIINNYMLRIEHGAGYAIHGNYFGGTQPEAGNSLLLMVRASNPLNCNRLTVIDLNGDETSDTNLIAFNVIRNIFVKGYPSIVEEIGFYGIKVNGSARSVVSNNLIENIIVKNETTNIIGDEYGGYGFRGIEFNADLGEVYQNSVQGILSLFDNFYSDRPSLLTGISIGGSGFKILAHHNLINGFTNKCISPNRAYVRGISSVGLNADIRIYENNIANLLLSNGNLKGVYINGINSSTTIFLNSISNFIALGSITNITGRTVGIEFDGSGAANIANNYISALASETDNETLDGQIAGIAVITQSTDAKARILENDIGSFTSNFPSTSSFHLTGIVVNSLANVVKIERNHIYDLINQSTGSASAIPPTISGISIRNYGAVGADSLSVVNNMIVLGDTSIDGSYRVFDVSYIGIWQNAQATGASPSDVANIWHNSVVISGNNPSATRPSYAYLRGDFNGSTINNTVRIRNNIFLNNREGGTAENFAIGNKSGSVGWPGGALPGSTHNLIYGRPNYAEWESTQLSTIDDWFAISGGSDPPAVTVISNVMSSYQLLNQKNPIYQPRIASARLFFDINETRINGRGTAEVIINDIHNDRRRGPDLGAHEVQNVLTWVGDANPGVWQDTANWNFRQVPKCCDVAIIPSVGESFTSLPYAFNNVYFDDTRTTTSIPTVADGFPAQFFQLWVKPDATLSMANHPDALMEGCWEDGLLLNQGIIDAANGTIHVAGNIQDDGEFLPGTSLVVLNNDSVISVDHFLAEYQNIYNLPSKNIQLNGTNETQFHHLSIINNGLATIGFNGAPRTIGVGLNGIGDLNIDPNSRLIMNANHLRLDGTVSNTGTITGHASSNLSVGGVGVPTDLGVLRFTTGANLLNILSINRIPISKATFAQSMDVNHLTLTEGVFDAITSSDVLHVLDPSTSAIDFIYPYNNGRSWVTNMLLRREINSAGTYALPVGSAANYELAEIELLASTGMNRLTAYFDPVTPVSPTFVPFWDYAAYLTELLPGGYWDVTPNAGYSNVQYNISVFPRGFGGVSLPPAAASANGYKAVTIVKNDATNSEWNVFGSRPRNFDGTIEHDGVQNGTGRLSRDGFATFSKFPLAGATNSPFPVEMLTFTAKLDNETDALLNWTTAVETNNAGFEVQHSLNGVDFNGLDFVQGHGTSSKPNKYAFTHKQIPAGVNYYRLKQTDFDGKSVYSAVAEVVKNGDGLPFDVVVYPNPTNGSAAITLNLTKETNFTVTINGLRGEEIYAQTYSRAAGNQQIILPIERLSAGVYFVTIRSGADVYTTKLVKEN